MVFRPLRRTPRALLLTRKLLKKFDQNLYAANAATSKLFSHRGEVSQTEQSLIKTFYSQRRELNADFLHRRSE